MIISERFRQFYFFTKRSTLLLEKSRKINFLHLFFIEQHAKLLPFLLMLVDQNKGTFLEKNGGYFKLSSEDILTSILSTFHPSLTLPNDDLKREKGTFLSPSSDLIKGTKKVSFFAVGSDALKSAKKVPYKIAFSSFWEAIQNLSD